MSDRFMNTAYGSVTLKAPKQQAVGATYMIEAKRPDGSKIGSRVVKDEVQAKRLYGRLVERVKLERIKPEHING